MNIRQIEAFHAVMTTGSVTRAGERMSISQPAVSQLIAQLERNCGFSLFERQGNKNIPTREAEALFIEVQRLFVGVGDISRVATALRNRTWGAVSVAAFPVIARQIIPRILWQFCESRPDTRIRFESMRSRNLIDAVAAHQIDIGLSIFPSDRPEVESRHLHRLRGVCVVPSGHPLARLETIHATDLADQEFISLGAQDQTRFMVDRVFTDLNVSRRLHIEAGQSDSVLAFVSAAAGVAVVDPICVDDNQDPRIAIRAFEPALNFDIWLIRPKVSRPFNLIDSAIEFLLERLDEYVVRWR